MELYVPDVFMYTDRFPMVAPYMYVYSLGNEEKKRSQSCTCMVLKLSSGHCDIVAVIISANVVPVAIDVSVFVVVVAIGVVAPVLAVANVTLLFVAVVFHVIVVTDILV